METCDTIIPRTDTTAHARSAKKSRKGVVLISLPAFAHPTYCFDDPSALSLAFDFALIVSGYVRLPWLRSCPLARRNHIVGDQAFACVSRVISHLKNPSSRNQDAVEEKYSSIRFACSDPSAGSKCCMASFAGSACDAAHQFS